MESYGLDMNNIRGQGYDGAGNMAGRIQGAAAKIKAKYPTALVCTLLPIYSIRVLLRLAMSSQLKHDGNYERAVRFL